MKKRIFGALLFCLMLFCFAGTAVAAEKEEHPYYITVNLTDNIVTIYEKDETGNYTVPIKAFYCSGGESTPEGTFQTIEKYEWRALFGDVWGQYATRITGHYLFHSVPYLEKDKTTLEYDEYNKLGSTASAGCIRLCVKDVKWIYDNCPIGTTVKMYRGNVEEPLQPAPVKKINTADLKRRGWDPTDPDSANPWRKGELREMAVQPSLLGSTVQAYHENNTYYLTAEDGKKLFSQLGMVLSLPEAAGQVVDDEIKVFYEGTEHQLSCRVKEGTVYYKLRDLATMVGAEMTWNNDTQEIGISYGGNMITVSRGPLVQGAVSLPAQIASLFRV
ncbi:MAG: L,D-transpeptidase family protein [Bacteroidales bacterium]|nr:L,D-transpeptidase family protein [Anaerotignum sp.]MCI5678458.1 L,D-transpeptidase family protein [Bacteroidales bacterium]MDY3926349.1 L,D-transpeptidase family protein [Anaerotignum sp.]